MTRAQGIRLSARVVHQFATGPGVLLLPADFLVVGRLSSVVERPTSIEEERTRVDEVPAHESLLGTAFQVFRAAPSVRRPRRRICIVGVPPGLQRLALCVRRQGPVLGLDDRSALLGSVLVRGARFLEPLRGNRIGGPREGVLRLAALRLCVTPALARVLGRGALSREPSCQFHVLARVLGGLAFPLPSYVAGVVRRAIELRGGFKEELLGMLEVAGGERRRGSGLGGDGAGPARRGIGRRVQVSRNRARAHRLLASALGGRLRPATARALRFALGAPVEVTRPLKVRRGRLVRFARERRLTVGHPPPGGVPGE